jgi:hypothetical protein
MADQNPNLENEQKKALAEARALEMVFLFE